MNGQNQQLDLFKQRLPKKPYCADDLAAGLFIRSVSTAIKHLHIQPNHPNSKLWLLFDIDRATGPEELTDELLLPAPTLWVQNPKNHHAHALYGLENAVHLNADSSQAAIRYASAVDVALSQKMDADAGYAGLVCKNPLHKYWRTYTTGGTYDLSDLSEYVDLNSFSDKRKNLPGVGLGRNCTLFDRLRKWAYKAIRQGWSQYERWLMAVEQRAVGYNDFLAPLDISEVKHIAKSVAKWTYKNFSPTQYDAYIDRLKAFSHSSEEQSRKGKIGAPAAAKVKRDKREKQIHQAIDALQNRGEKVTKSAVARMVGVDRRILNKCYADIFDVEKWDLRPNIR